MTNLDFLHAENAVYPITPFIHGAFGHKGIPKKSGFGDHPSAGR